ncbi:hypothetical protein [Dysgonomonas sp. 520]|uniref:hypothetical protein n=1 Tax=Dysgonomonas sp. 520 TaxID=2302931 RepID=UPI0013D03E90|nr:hypothetical protein [Dysgonomonas sp. 520]NDW08749.1 hypothetical protein [Dysgonomonas sp. 520]
MQIQQIISGFQVKRQQLSVIVDKVQRGKFRNVENIPRIKTPCIISDLLQPIVNELMSGLPELNLDPASAMKLHIRGGYYKVYNRENKVIGRFSCKFGKSVKVYYANAEGNIFGENKEVNNLSELAAIIKSKAK